MIIVEIKQIEDTLNHLDVTLLSDLIIKFYSVRSVKQQFISDFCGNWYPRDLVYP